MPDLARYVTIVAEEPSYGTDGVDDLLTNGTSSDTIQYLPARSVDITPEAETGPPDRVDSSISGKPGPYVEQRCTFEMEVPLLIGDDGADGAPPYAALLRACNLSESLQDPDSTADSGDEFTRYVETTVNETSATIHRYTRDAETGDYRLRRVRGARGMVELELSMGDEAILTISGSGYYQDITASQAFFNSDGELVLDPDGNSVTFSGSFEKVQADPIYVEDMTFQVDSTDYPIDEMTYEHTLTQDEIMALTNPEGEHDQINTRGAGERGTGGFNVLDFNTESDFDDLITDYNQANQVELSATVSEPTGTGELGIRFPQIQIVGPEEEGENGNLVSYQFNFAALGDPSASLNLDNELEFDFDPSPASP